MGIPVFQVERTGVGASIQDGGRAGWAAYGVPPGGAMDTHAAGWANRLLDNAAECPVLELLMQGARLKVLSTCWLAVTGADARCSLPTWRVVRAHAGEILSFPVNMAGLWSYVAVPGGFEAPSFLNSAAAHPRARLGGLVSEGDVLEQRETPSAMLPRFVAGRFVASSERRDYHRPPPLRVWRGPQWDLFPEQERRRFFDSEWTVSPQSDRTGFRLQGTNLNPAQAQILSEPVLVGTIQIPPGGQPIVILNDGPTVGGYPKLGLIDPDDLARFVQCRPGTPLRFRLVP